MLMNSHTSHSLYVDTEYRTYCLLSGHKIEISVKHKLCLKPLPSDLTKASLAQNLLAKNEILFFLLDLVLEILVGSLSCFKFSPSWLMLDDFNKFDFEFQPSWRPTEIQKRKQKKKIHRGVQRLHLQET